MSLVTQLADLTTRIATETKAIRTLVNGNTVDLSALTTTTKANVVAALNELDAAIAALAAGSGAISDATTATTTTWSSSKTTAAIAAAIAGLVDAAPALLDTLNELAAALGDDPNFAATMATTLAGKQPLDADLTAIAALVSAANKMPYATAAGVWALADLTVFARTLIDDADAATARTTLGLGTAATTAATAYDTAGAATAAQAAAVQRANHTGTQLAATISDFGAAADARVVAGITAKQPLDADLTAIAALVSAADKMPYATGVGTWALTGVTAFARTVLDDADNTTARATLAVYSTTEIGSVTTDFVATFNAGLI